MCRRPLGWYWTANHCSRFMSVRFRWSNQFFSCVFKYSVMSPILSLLRMSQSSVGLLCLKNPICTPSIFLGSSVVYGPDFAIKKQSWFQSDINCLNFVSIAIQFPNCIVSSKLLFLSPCIRLLVFRLLSISSLIFLLHFFNPWYDEAKPPHLIE